MRPRIGITPTSFSERAYWIAVEACGGLPVVIDLHTPLSELPALVEALDGMLFSGGEDVDPAYYGQAREALCGDSSQERDALELALLKLAMARELPVLGICRGAQLIDVGLGGTLVQDIPSRLGANHRQPDGAIYHHEVEIASGTLLHRLLQSGRAMTNSFHHQCVLAPGQGLAVGARAGAVIEGIELPGYKFLLGVQWHPERTLMHDEISRRLFEAFIGACTGAGLGA